MDPSTGTFTTMDTYQGRLSDPMSLHKYMYAAANPIKYCDPSGNNYTVAQQGLAIGIALVLLAVDLFLIHTIGINKAYLALTNC